jgi:hypothetical protein
MNFDELYASRLTLSLFPVKTTWDIKCNPSFN